MSKLLLNMIIAFSAIGCIHGQDLVRFVNPFIGTANSGNTNPGAVLPWGMISLSPFNSYDTITGNSQASPYYYGNKYIYEFTHVNMSGVGCADLGIVCLMPLSGQLNIKQLHRSEYSDEHATPGYYSVMLDDDHIRVEISATPRSAISCYTFPEGQSHILLDMGLGLTSKKGAVIQRVSDVEVQGFKNIGDICGLRTIQTVYFIARVSKQPIRTGVWSEGKDQRGFQGEVAGNGVGAFFSFDTKSNEKIYIKTSISYVSIKNARENLETEQKEFDFEQTRIAAGKAWNEELSKIKIEGGTHDDRVKFYTAVYHALLHPNIYNDVNGEYRQFEHSQTGYINHSQRYTVFSLWDTYRCLHPFLSLLFPQKQSAMIKSLLGMAKENGWLPRWEYAGVESGAMTGDPSLIVIADTWLRGIHDFDIEMAYEEMKHNATTPEKNNYMRPGMDDWLRYGYIPEDAPNVLHPFGKSAGSVNNYENMREQRIVWGSVSTSLEYCIADWNLAQLAKYLGKPDDEHYFRNRSMLYGNNFDSSVGLMRSRFYDGKWVVPFNPSSIKNNAFTEGTSWNYSFMVPHDIPGLIKLMGGDKKFMSKLDTCFDYKYFDITNEPDIGYPYLYNYVKGSEWKSQQRTHEIVSVSFKNSPDGLPGNDDCGALSSWLIFSMIGIYPACPGSMDYQLTSPSFSKITMLLDPEYYPGKSFVIETKASSGKNILIKAMRFNGKAYKKFNIKHQDIVNGGRLEFILGDKK